MTTQNDQDWMKALAEFRLNRIYYDDYMPACEYGFAQGWKAHRASQVAALPQQAAPEQATEPFGYAYQHDETGRMTCVSPEEIEENWFAKMNPRWKLVGSLYLAAPPRSNGTRARERQHER